jgi:uncharacterized ferredoxin-like protein
MRNFDREVNREYIEVAAKAVAAAAKSAPHTTGNLDLVIHILNQEEIATIQKTVAELFQQDKESVIVYDGMLTIGAKTTYSDTHWDCGACGFSTCAELNKAAKAEKEKNPSEGRQSGPSCNWKVLDWNISMDYAAAMASQLGLQTRVQDIQGSIALQYGFAGDVDVCTTVPLMAEKRNPLFGGRFDMATKEDLKVRRAQAEVAFKRLFPVSMDLEMLDVFVAAFGYQLSPNLSGLIETGPPVSPSGEEEKNKE